MNYSHWTDVDRTWWSVRWPNFAPEEMACPSTGMIITSEIFMNSLQELRTALGKPMYLTSACRSSQYNDSIGGKSKSFHITNSQSRVGANLGCLAVDVASLEGFYRGELFALAWNRGWTVGWNARQRFLHIDRRIQAGWVQTSFDY